MITVLKKIFAAARDGSLAHRVLNRFSKTKYGPITEPITSDVLKQFYPGGEWTRLSTGARSVWLKLHEVFETSKIQNILWVGGCDGEDAVLLNEAFPGREIHILEPVADSFQQLCANVAPYPNMHAWQVAAGAAEGELEMFVDEFRAASSLLPYAEITLEHFPFLGRQTRQKVKVRAVDDLVAEWGCNGIDFMFVDVQGFEDNVLRGGVKMLAGCRGVLIELSLQQFYSASSTFESVYDVLIQAGFKLRGVTMAHRDARGIITQLDGLFLRA